MHIVLKGKDGFQKELEVDFDNKMAPYTYTVRQYLRLYSPFYYHPDDVLKFFDREFRLKSQFYALGKQIAYYEEI